MPRARLIPMLLTASSLLVGQAPAEPAAADPVPLVARAEAQARKGDREAAVLLAWEALAALATLADDPVRGATRLAAWDLLREVDPIEPDRRRAFEAIARQQLDLAQAYRGRKWFDTALARVDVAQHYDRFQADKARAALLAARPTPAATAPAVPAAPPKVATAALLQRTATLHVFGTWTEADGMLRTEALAANGPLAMWMTKASHEDHEIVLEFRPEAPDEPHNIAIVFGGFVDATVDGARAECIFDARMKGYYLRLFTPPPAVTELAGNWVRPTATTDGFRRLALRVAGTQVQLQLDGEPAVTATWPQPARGLVGLSIGVVDTPAGALQLRTLRIDPLPADQPTDEELREQRLAALQQSIAGAVDAAKKLRADKQAEAAAWRLRGALAEVRQMPAGRLRDSLDKVIEQELEQTDPLAARRKKAALEAAAQLVGLADRYAAAGQVRAAFVLVAAAARFDAGGTTARLEAATEAVQAWNLAQATARAAELAPPADDGAVLREWFANGRLLDSRSPAWTVEGPAARIDVAPGSLSVLMSKADMPPPAEVAVHVRLPATGASAGLCFDAAGPHDYAAGFLRRDRQDLWLHAYRFAGGKWTELRRVKVRVDAWQLDGWLPIAFARTPQGCVLRGAGAELKLDPKLLHNGDPRIGLYADSDADAPLTIEARAFRLGP
ncbi:MAG: hypothetical protein JNL08_01765 [Planctomycetes bacterium]|nr:hypothetical protein [Planctomycetota bacterium]